MKYSIENILKKACLFEINSLISLSNINIHHNFIRYLESFLDSILYQEDVDAWFKKNTFQLKDKLLEPWYVDYSSKIPFFHSHLGNNIWARIYKTADLPQDFNIQQSIFLQGHKDIPNLWMYIGTQEDSYGLWDLNLDLSHNAWLVSALQSLFGIHNITPDFLQQASQFITLNKDKIDRIRSLFKNKPNMIGSGTNGVAFSISDSLVLKIFLDLYSFEEAKKSINRLHADQSLAKTEAMIYDVGQLGSFDDHILYYYVIELMKPITELEISLQKKIEIIIKFIVQHINAEKYKWMKIKEDLNNPLQKNHLIKEIKIFTNQLLSSINENNKELIELIEVSLNLKQSWLSSLIEEILIKYLTGRGDLHIGNLGITNYGELRYFDPSHENWINYLNY